MSTEPVARWKTQGPHLDTQTKLRAKLCFSFSARRRRSVSLFSSNPGDASVRPMPMMHTIPGMADIVRSAYQSAVYTLNAVRRGTYAAALFSLYRRAAALGVVGGWAGRPDSAVCAAMSAGTSPEFWSATAPARQECAHMIYARFDGILVVVEAVVVVFCLLRFLAWYAQHCMLVRPFQGVQYQSFSNAFPSGDRLMSSKRLTLRSCPQ